MSTALDRIIAYKRDEVAALKREHSASSLLQRANSAPSPRGFAKAMDKTVEAGANALICELKRKSPSAGEIVPGADPVEIAKQYEQGGATCLSILTDFPSFGGSLADLEQVKAAVSLPILRKEFMIDTLQVIEARAHGADAILVILSAVDDALARELCESASELGMDTIVEVHDAEELDRANQLPGHLIGINNRNLKEMVTDLATTERLAPQLATGKTLISESGISTPDHISRLKKAGANRFLIGESLMKSEDRANACKKLRSAN